LHSSSSYSGRGRFARVAAGSSGRSTRFMRASYPGPPTVCLSDLAIPEAPHRRGGLLERFLRLVEPAGAQLAAAVGLPELPCLHVKAGQPALTVDPRVDAD